MAGPLINSDGFSQETKRTKASLAHYSFMEPSWSVVDTRHLDSSSAQQCLAGQPKECSTGQLREQCSSPAVLQVKLHWPDQQQGSRQHAWGPGVAGIVVPVMGQTHQGEGMEIYKLPELSE